MSEPSLTDKLARVFVDAARAQRDPDEGALIGIGGWSAVAAAAPALVDEPLLTPTLALCVRELRSARTDERARAAMTALVDAVVATVDPRTFIDGLEILLRSEPAIKAVGDYLADALAPVSGPPAEGAAAGDVERHAAALEGLYRLAVGAVGSTRRLLLGIEQVGSPQPLRYARALVRVIPAAIDVWPDADDLSLVLDRVRGATAPAAGMHAAGTAAQTYPAWVSAIADDAAVAAANIALIRALRAPTPSSAAEQVGRALEVLELARGSGRDDVEVLAGVLAVLGDVLTAHVGGDGALNAGALTVQTAGALRQRVSRWLVAGAGLTHWATAERSDAYIAWSQLADDLVDLAGHVGSDSLYDAAVVMNGVLSTYVRARRFAVVAHDDDLGMLWTLIQPAVEQGFAAHAGLMRNLVDHRSALERRLEQMASDDDARDEVAGELEACRRLVEAARAAMDVSAGKGSGVPAQVTSPNRDGFAWMERLFPSGYKGVIDTRYAERITDAIAMTDASRPETSHELQAIAAVRDQLASSPDYHGQQRTAVNHVLGLMVRFVADRANSERRVRRYLFNPAASEADLHVDLADFLTSQARVRIEQSNVGGGRCDLEVSFNGFHLYIELKADDALTPLADKHDWVNQTVEYTKTNVRIAFLMALRRHPAGVNRPDMHLTEVVGHTTVDVPGETDPRHVVTLSVVGNRASPSQMSARTLS